MYNFKDKKVAVLGLLEPGLATLDLVQKEGGKPTGFGRATEKELNQIQQRLKNVEVNLEDISGTGLLSFDCVITTPGSSRRYATQIEQCRKKSIPVFTDLELALSRYKAPVIAVTGTNGKSTVVHLLKNIFELAGKKVLTAGGDYQSFSESISKPSACDFVILELNSSRLMRAQTVSPHIAVITNIYSGHSERHKSFKEYADAKAKIFTHQKKGDFLVYQKTTGLIDELIQEKSPQTSLYPFTFSGDIERGTYLNIPQKQIIFKDEKGRKSIYSYANFTLLGTQNVENAMAAIAVAKLCDIEDHFIQKMLETVKVLPDRMEALQKVNGILFVNDAKAVNALATYTSLHGFKDHSVVLIAGGNFSPHIKNKYLLEMMKQKVRCLIVFGEERRDFHKVWGTSTETYVVTTLKDAVKLALEKAEKGNVVLFSPAARAELHSHGSTQKRGLEFKRLVKEVAALVQATKTMGRF